MPQQEGIHIECVGAGQGLDLERLRSLEWLETNGLGGWSSSTLSGANTRSYHGLLVAAVRPPVQRMVLLAGLGEALSGSDGKLPIAGNVHAGESLDPGLRFPRAYSQDPFPCFEYDLGGLARLRKTVAAVHGENSVVVRYELSAARAFGLELRPLLAGRDYHGLKRANAAMSGAAAYADGVLRMRTYAGVAEVWLAGPAARWSPQGAWDRRVVYERERERGLDYEEDLFCPGSLHLDLAPGEAVYLLVSTENPSGRDPARLMAREGERRRALEWGMPADATIRTLVRATDQFLAARGHGLRTVIAGYPWFTDWGRDTMISLPGLCLAPGGLSEARDILQAFMDALSRGQVPNRFPDTGELADYNSVDATLWLFVAVHAFWRAGGDAAFVQGHCLPALLDCLDWHRRGTRFGIAVEKDGLLRSGAPGVQLTWMDAKVGEWVVTPRQGKAVEINALWYNALCICRTFCVEAGRGAEALALAEEAERVKLAFQALFWDPQTLTCHDVVDGDRIDASVRPNQIFALSLPFSLLDGERAEAVLRKVADELLTPVGLRTLSPRDPRYRPACRGDQAQRDGAYHQGTVWPWLLGPYIDALFKVRGEAARGEARALWKGMEGELRRMGVGSICEIYDGDAPWSPRGCPAQAWSVTELLRVGLEYRLYL